MKNNIDYDPRTGLLFVNTVPFGKEMIDNLQTMFDYSTEAPQFDFAIKIIDKSNNATDEGTVTIDYNTFDDMKEFIRKNNIELASCKDFK